MPVATLTSKGQITIPMALREALGLHAGVRLDFFQDAQGFRAVRAAAPTAPLKGRFAGRVRKPVTLAEMDAAISEEASARFLAPKRPRGKAV